MNFTGDNALLIAGIVLFGTGMAMLISFAGVFQ